MPGRHCLQAIRLAYEGIQVELQGRYSLPRLREILAHGQQSTLARNMAVVLLTPFPGLLLLIVMDALPLNEPERGIRHQTVGLYFRVFMCGWIMAFMMAMQIHQSSPTLPLSPTRLWVISIVVGLITMTGLWIYGTVIGFPSPFVAQLLTPPWFVSFTACLWISWKTVLQSDVQAKQNLVKYSLVFVSQCTIILVYTAYGIVFRHVPSSYQTVVSFLLPAMKLFFRNWVSVGVHHMEDLAPSVIVFNVDVFHAMFVGSTMQQSTTSGTTVFVMLVDIGQMCVAFGEIQTVLRRATRLATASQKEDASVDSKRPFNHRASDLVSKLGVIDYALRVLDTKQRIRDHPDVSNARHLRKGTRRLVVPQSVTVQSSTHQTTSFAEPLPDISAPPMIVPSAANGEAAKGDKYLKATETDDVSSRRMSRPIHPKVAKTEQMQVECVKCVLKMLHMVEFYLLIEFVEVIIAAIYTIYMWTIAYMPNRQYYSHLDGKTHEEIMAMVSRLAIYTSLELLSFIVFCVIVDRKLRQVSSIQILAFVLQKHVRMVQTTLSMWVFFVVQLTFEHFGTDYTFQFKWLREKDPTSG